MGRRPKAIAEATVAPAEDLPTRRPGRPKTTAEGATPAPVRRRRRSAVDHGAQGQILVSSLLKGRGTRGATQEEALTVVLWARGVHAEAADLKALATQVRKAKSENAAERQVVLSLNQSLLDGVLAGSLVVDVDGAGSVSFRQAN